MHRYKETIKSYVLLALIIITILQVGILYDYQNHGLPISFFTQFFGKSTLAESEPDVRTRERLFSPYRISVSNGNEKHYIVGSGTDQYKKLWEDAHYYLKSILAAKRTPVAASADEWRSLVIKKSVLIEFKPNIRNELLKWFLDEPGSQSSEPQGLYKMILIPSVGQNEIEIDLLDQWGVRKYMLPYRDGGMDVRSYMALIGRYQQDKDYAAKEYSLIQDLGFSSKLAISPDILCVVREPIRQYPDLSYKAPASVEARQTDALGDMVLGIDKNSYDSYTDSEGTTFFKNLDNMYRIYSDGLLEYKYLPGQVDVSRGNIGAAFSRAGEFLGRAQKLLGNSAAHMYLSSVETGSQSYKFRFDYKIGDYPIYMKYASKGKDGEPLNNAAVIEVNSKRVVSARLMLKEFTLTRATRNYNVGISSMINSAGLSLNELDIKDMGVAYVIDGGEAKDASPYWVMERSGGAVTSVKLKNEKGD